MSSLSDSKQWRHTFVLFPMETLCSTLWILIFLWSVKRFSCSGHRSLQICKQAAQSMLRELQPKGSLRTLCAGSRNWLFPWALITLLWMLLRSPLMQKWKRSGCSLEVWGIYNPFCSPGHLGWWSSLKKFHVDISADVRTIVKCVDSPWADAARSAWSLVAPGFDNRFCQLYQGFTNWF